MITINTRIAQKSDVQDNWNKCVGFVPLRGEIIVYLPDKNHSISRIKVGDGMAYLIDLPFISNEQIDQHIANTVIHTNLQEKSRWDNKINCQVFEEQTLTFYTN